MSGKLGEVLIRCNNVLYLRKAPETMDAIGEAPPTAMDDED